MSSQPPHSPSGNPSNHYRNRVKTPAATIAIKTPIGATVTSIPARTSRAAILFDFGSKIGLPVYNNFLVCLFGLESSLFGLN